ncbi:MAG: (Fe-S)-binding protein [Deltaproteobacteria bacterium]|nr:(Fe-S)-binding protein [Deltaproteobacteria bacterium]
MKLGLFIPCYVDQLRPEVGLAAVRLLDALGLAFDFPEAQTCCGQPFLTAGERGHAERLARCYVDVFAAYDVVVTPSGSCAAHVRDHLPGLAPGEPARRIAGRTRELCEFLVETGALHGRSGRYPHRVGLHASCHALRGLRHGRPSESREPGEPIDRAPSDAAPASREPARTPFDPARRLLESLAGLELVPLARRDECCGFGGVFAVEEEAVSCRMGLDRLADHEAAGAAVVTSSDVSCLLQLEGLARRRGSPLVFRHVAEILAEAFACPPSAGGALGSR